MTKIVRLLRTTAFKLSLVYLVLTAIVATALIGTIVFQTSSLLRQQVQAALDLEVATLDGVYDTAGITGVLRTVERRANQPGSNLYLVTTPLGQPLAGNVLTIDPSVVTAEGTREVAYAREEENRVARSAVVRTAVLQGGYRLLVGHDLEEQQRFRAIIARATAVGGVAMLLLGLGGGWLVASRIARRIDAMSATSRSIMAGDLSRRLPQSGNDDEFDRLAGSVNAMLERIEELMRGLKEVSDNIAHDLKTPLTRLRTRAEAALRSRDTDELRLFQAAALDDIDGLIRTFDALLMIARAESGAGAGSFVPVDLREVTASVAELYEAVAEDKGLTLALDGPERLVVPGNRELLAQAVANLVDNAVKHVDAAPSDGPAITVSVEAEGEGARIVVADRGPGIPEGDRTRVTERFVRLEASRSRPGAGLGLSLVAAIARLHGGTLTFGDNAPGLRAVLTIGSGTSDRP